MKTQRTRKSARDDGTALWLGGAAALLLALVAAMLAYVHDSQMQALRQQAAQTRAHLMAQSIGERLDHALSAGIPLRALVGVEQFLERWHASHPEITHIAVDDLQGRTLWRSRHASGSTGAALGSGTADVTHAGMVQARVTLELQGGSTQGLARILALLVPAVLLVSALAFLGARFSCAQGPWLRNHGVRTIARWAIRGDYRRWLVLSQQRQFDLRVQEVAHGMRSVHERMGRMRLLIGSLRRTEPQQLRRNYLDQVLQQTEGSDRFTDAEPGIVRLVAVQAQSQWMALMACLGALAPLSYALRAIEPGTGAWQQALPAACLGALALAAAAGWQLCARLRIATLSVLILGLAALLLSPLALLFDSGLHPAWIAAWNGFFAGAALAACTRAQTHPDRHPGFAHAQPQIPGAALQVWWSGWLWLAPALGYYAHAALRPGWALAALLLPSAGALFLATRWDVAHSPWRVRMVDAHAPRRAGAHWPLWALGIAAGLVAGPLLLALTTPAASDLPVLLQQCALGLGLATAWAGPRRIAPHHGGRGPWPVRPHWTAIALLAAAAQLALLAVDALAPAPWRVWVQILPALLLGWLLAQGLAQAAQSPQDTAGRSLLLCAALGAALSAVAGALGLPGAPWVLAALLLLPAVRAKGPDVA